MTVRELCRIAEQGGFLDAELMMNVNLDVIPVARALYLASYPVSSNVVISNIVILDN